MSRAWLVLALVAACHEDKTPTNPPKEPPAAPTADCAGAVDHMAELQRSALKDTPESDGPHYEERITKMREAMLRTCNETKWSAERTTCMKNMKSFEDAARCEALATPEQSDAEEKALEATQKP